MKIIGITGGVGAGKSEILKHLQDAYQAYVIQADQVGHLVMEPGQDAYKAIVETFQDMPSDVNVAPVGSLLREDGTIDRGVLGSIVFSDGEKLKMLNSIIHPAVKQWIRDEIGKKQKEGTRLLVVEAALLIEDGYASVCDELWYIHTNQAVRRERLKASRGYSDEKIDAICRNQLSETEFRGACQAVIDNSGAFEDTRQQIADLFAMRNWF